MSIIADIQISLESGKEYLKSTCMFNDDRKLHDPSMPLIMTSIALKKLSKNISNKLPDTSNERQLEGVTYKFTGENSWWIRAIIIYFKIHRLCLVVIQIVWLLMFSS